MKGPSAHLGRFKPSMQALAVTNILIDHKINNPFIVNTSQTSIYNVNIIDWYLNELYKRNTV